MFALSGIISRFGFDFPGLFRPVERASRAPEPWRKVFDPRTATAEELYEHYRFRMD